MIGHTRYSTSDLLYNQPISNDVLSVAHNGVISQEPPEDWESIYGLKTKTRNDSELILQCIMRNKEPLTMFKNSSMAYCALMENKTLIAARNGERPLYLTNFKEGIIFTSTKDIAKRSGLEFPIKTEMNTKYIIHKEK